MLLDKPDLPQRGSTMWPEILAPKTDCGLNVLLANGLRFGATEHRPVQISQRTATHSLSRPSSSGFSCARKVRKVSKATTAVGDKFTVRIAKTPSSSVVGKLMMRVRAF